MKKTWTKRLAALLAVALLVSLAPTVALAEERAETPGSVEAEGQATPLSLLPLEEVKLNLDLSDSGLFLNDLDEVPVSKLLELTDITGRDGIETQAGDVILWVKGEYDPYGFRDHGMGDQYTQVALDGTMDLTPVATESDYYWNRISMELIVGKADQLNTANKRYLVNLTLPEEDPTELFDVDAYFLPTGEETARTQVEWNFPPACYETWMTRKGGATENAYEFYGSGVKESWKANADLAVGLTLKEEFSDLKVTFYEGRYETEAEITAAGKNAKNITKDILDQKNLATEGGYTVKQEWNWDDQVTAVIQRGKKTLDVRPYVFYLTEAADRVSVSSALWDAEGQNRITNDYDYDWENNIEKRTYWMANGRATEQAALKADFDHNEESVDAAEYVEKTVASASPVSSFRAAASLEDISADLFGAKGYVADFSKGVYITAFSKDEGNPVINRFYILTKDTDLQVYPGYIENVEGGFVADWSKRTADGAYTYTMPSKDTPANEEYALAGMMEANGFHGTANAYVEKMVAGTRFYNSLDAAKNEADIKDDFFGAGYKADYSKTVRFTVFWKIGTVSTFSVQTVNNTSKPVEPEPEPVPQPVVNEIKDTYFYVNGANKDAEAGGRYNAWVMPGNVDGYYFGYADDAKNFGCQTVMLLDGAGAVADETELYPTFVTGQGVTAFTGHGGVAANKVESGKGKITFKSGETFQYSATAEDNKLAKNYWVTFVTQQTGAKLYANANIASLADKDSESKNPVRRISLDGAHNFYHDIFFANIGDAQLEGLKVELTGAKNIALDPYWTVGETKTLAAFTTTTETTEAGLLPNVGKIRLVPERDKNGAIKSGDIEGTLTISSTNGGEISFDLTGKTQNVQIVTEELSRGVKFVSYNSLIQTDVMGASDAVRFSYTGRMPKGVTLFENGKLYGVPTEYGDFNLRVTASYTAPGEEKVSSVSTKELRLVILNDTMDNVKSATDKGYELLDPFPEEIDGDSNETMHSKGEYNTFYALFLNGKELVRGKDYTVSPGSAKIVIQASVLGGQSGGSGTLSAEFRTDRSDTNTVKRTATKYNLKSSGGSSGGGGGSFVGGGGGGGTPATGGKPATGGVPANGGKPANGGTPTEKTGSERFADVLQGSWYEPAVAFVVKQDLFHGVDEAHFDPDGTMTRAMLVTVLARLDGVDTTGGDTWYQKGIDWAMAQGISDGTMPESNVTREQMVTMLYRYSKAVRNGGDLNAFVDAASVSDWAVDAVNWAVAQGILKGDDHARLDPNGNATRAEAATILMRYFQLVKAQ